MESEISNLSAPATETIIQGEAPPPEKALPTSPPAHPVNGPESATNNSSAAVSPLVSPSMASAPPIMSTQSEERISPPSGGGNVELPSIGMVTGGMKGRSSLAPMNKGPMPMQRQNIIQLPGNMLGSKGTLPSGMGPTSPHQHQHPHDATVPPPPPPPPSNPNRMMSPPFGNALPPSGYGSHLMMNGPNPGAPSQNYHLSSSGPPPPPPPPPSGPPGQNPQQQQRMELHDAFAYLDRVKAEFADHPDVYNRFLQIMREFKANAIDANGVIVRVVQLFKGHKTLIQGFNAFLPRTHHIDPIVAETGILPPHLMQVAASMGIAVNAQGIPASLPSISGPSSAYQPPSWVPECGPPPPPPAYYAGPPQYSSGYPHQIPPRPPTGITPGATIPIAAPLPPISTANHPAPSAASSSTGKKSSAQFVRAISYVKKIKHRFANDPEVYKTFLGALHSYHKEQKTIFEVYMEVANLFADHPDLLEEFVLFLPENEAAVITSRLSQSGISPTNMMSNKEAASTSRTDSSKAAAAPKRPAQPPPQPSKTSKRARQAASIANRTAEESAFYERVKRYLGDKHAYSEFLKCLNLFCQDIIKMQDLVHLVNRFIGQNEELFGWFKRYIGYKEADALELSTNEPLWRVNESLVNDNGELNLQACKKTGSYRLYPKSHILPKSSHRTDIGHEVLNDTMVSCPVFNSEDSTFIASKKNQYEEALFRCEDERFELDLLIDYNLATIAVFEPLARKIEAMSEQERTQLTLGPNLGGTSTVIYKKAIKKIYGEKAEEVILGLQKNPTVAVPIVLRRLKQKDEEWRQIQRDWNKVWRDIHVKNFYKALDHQGIEFKVNDRRNISGRTLITEIENLAAEKRRASERGDSQPTTANHVELNCRGNAELVEDLSKLLKTYVKSSPSFNSNDRKAILRFITSFLPSVFSLSVTLPTGQDQVVAHDSASQSEDSATDAGSESEGGDGPREPKSNKVDLFEGATFSRGPVNAASAPPILLFANNNLYVLCRLLQICLDRLDKMFTASKAANGSPFFTEKRNVVASFLDLQHRAEIGPEHQGDYYSTMLILLRQLIAGNIDSGIFEERIRFMFGTTAYAIFTFDKLLQAFAKQIQSVLSDGACEQLIRLFDSWNSRKNNMRLSEYSIRMAVESVVPGKENIYRIEFDPRNNQLCIQLLERLGEGAGSSGTSAESRWSEYVDNFIKLESNSLYLNPKVKVFLGRNRRKEVLMDPGRLQVSYNLECKIAINTYKLFYVENTEDYLFRAIVRPPSNKCALKRFQQWLARSIS